MKAERYLIVLLILVGLAAFSYASCDICSPNACPSGYSETSCSCSGGTCTRVCSGSYGCSNTVTNVWTDSDTSYMPNWNDDSYDEYDYGRRIGNQAVDSNHCYMMEYHTSTSTSYSSDCIDLETDDDCDPDDYDEDCDGDDLDAWSGAGFYAGSGNTWLSTVTSPGCSRCGWTGSADNSYWDYIYVSDTGENAAPDQDGSDAGEWEGLNDQCDETYAIYCAPTQAARDAWGKSMAGYGCSGYDTKPYFVVGIYKDDYGDLRDALYDKDPYPHSMVTDNDYSSSGQWTRLTEYAMSTSSTSYSCSAECTSDAQCGTCMQCSNYHCVAKSAGTDCGTCMTCNGAGSCSSTPSDDSDCGIIDCDGKDTACRDYNDITSGRCEAFGDCKDANTADCSVYNNQPSGTDCGTCQACDGTGSCSSTPSDDSDCGVIDCDVFDTECRNYYDLTSGRCKAFGQCKVQSDCNSYNHQPDGTVCGNGPTCESSSQCVGYRDGCKSGTCSDRVRDDSACTSDILCAAGWGMTYFCKPSEMIFGNDVYYRNSEGRCTGEVSQGQCVTHEVEVLVDDCSSSEYCESDGDRSCTQNEPPYWEGSVAPVTIGALGRQELMSLWPYMHDKETEDLTLSIAYEDLSKVNCDIEGRELYGTPANGWHGDTECCVKIYDGIAYSNQNCVTITVEDAMVLSLEDVKVTKGQPLTFDLMEYVQNSADVDFSIASGPCNVEGSIIECPTDEYDSYQSCVEASDHFTAMQDCFNVRIVPSEDYVFVVDGEDVWSGSMGEVDITQILKDNQDCGQEKCNITFKVYSKLTDNVKAQDLLVRLEDPCVVSLVNVTMDDWHDVGDCLTNDTNIQQRSIKEYDSNSCGIVENSTYVEERLAQCDYCTPIWQGLNGSCILDIMTEYHVDVNDCFALTGLEADNIAPEDKSYACNNCTSTFEPVVEDCRPDGYQTVSYIYTNDCCTITGLESDCNKPSDHEEKCGLACGDEISADITLTNDLVGCSDGLIIVSDDITLECDGHKITGIDKNGFGISSSGHDNINIQNCVITGFNEGVVVYGGNNLYIGWNEFIGNVKGLNLNYIKDSHIEINYMLNNTYFGIIIGRNSTGNLIESNWVHGNPVGAEIMRSYGNNITRNKIDYNDFGIQFDQSDLNTITHNSVYDNQIGINVLRSNDNLFVENDLRRNTNGAHEYNISTENRWNNSYVGNEWDDFEYNYGYPTHYFIPGNGGGIDYHPEGACIASEELCDGIDNDCDGEVDEGDVCSCTPYWVLNESWTDCMPNDLIFAKVSDRNKCGVSFNPDTDELHPPIELPPAPSRSGEYIVPIINDTCDYCTPNWVEVNSTCNDGLKTGTYIDRNGCYDITGLEADLEDRPDDNTYDCADYLTIGLEKGWNLVSFPTDQNINVNDLKSRCSIAGTVWQWSRRAYHKATNLTMPNGNWVYSLLPCEFEVTKTTNVQPIELAAGWNMVGFYEEDSLGNLPGNCVVIGTAWDYDSSLAAYMVTDHVEPGKAYWIYVHKSCTVDQSDNGGSRSVEILRSEIVFGEEYVEECKLDSDCGEVFSSEPYCLEGSVFEDSVSYSCNYGTCEQHNTTTKIESCRDSCFEGGCIESAAVSDPAPFNEDTSGGGNVVEPVGEEDPNINDDGNGGDTQPTVNHAVNRQREDPVDEEPMDYCSADLSSSISEINVNDISFGYEKLKSCARTDRCDVESCCDSDAPCEVGKTEKGLSIINYGDPERLLVCNPCRNGYYQIFYKKGTSADNLFVSRLLERKLR